MTTGTNDTSAHNETIATEPSGNDFRDRMTCPECRRNTNKIYTLLRAPKPPLEIRACEKCRPGFERDQGMVVTGTRRQHGRTREGALCCHGCGNYFNRTFIMSATGEPTDAKACPDCAENLKALGWRAVSMAGTT